MNSNQHWRDAMNNERQTHERTGVDPLQSLLKRAGRRPDVPTHHTEIVRAAALEQWQKTVRRETRRRYTGRTLTLLAAAVAVAIGLAWISPMGLLWGPSSFAGPVGVLEVVDGHFSARRSDKMLPLPQIGEPILSGTVLETGSSRLALRMSNGPSVRLDRHTKIRCLTPTEFVLEKGAVYVDTDRSAAGEPVESTQMHIQTVLGTVYDIGTRFEVRLEAESENPMLTVRVRDGQVGLKDSGAEPSAEAGGPTLVKAGQAMTLNANGELTQESIQTHGESWSWIEKILPAFPADGNSVADLFRWLAYEGDLKLEFAGSASEFGAGQVKFTGSVQGLDFDQALELALLGSGHPWTYRVVDGRVLLIEGVE